MPTVKKTNAVLKTHTLSFILFGIAAAVVVGYALLTNDFSPSSAIPVVMLVLGIGLYFQQRRWRRFLCPTCRQLLTRERAFDGSPLIFQCDRCDTIWDNGFTDSESE